MSLFNYNSKEIHCKIIYYGPAEAGKTSNIKWICRNTQDQKWDVFSIPLKTKPSSFFDFLPLDIGIIRGFKTRFHLYTIPGNQLFETSQKLLLKGLDGVVFVADSQKEKMPANKESMNKLKRHLTEEGLSLEKIPMVIQYNKRDLNNIHSITQMRTALNHHNHPDFPGCAEKGQTVFEPLKTLLKMVLTVLKGGNF